MNREDFYWLTFQNVGDLGLSIGANNPSSITLVRNVLRSVDQHSGGFVNERKIQTQIERGEGPRNDRIDT